MRVLQLEVQFDLHALHALQHASWLVVLVNRQIDVEIAAADFHQGIGGHLHGVDDAVFHELEQREHTDSQGDQVRPGQSPTAGQEIPHHDGGEDTDDPAQLGVQGQLPEIVHYPIHRCRLHILSSIELCVQALCIANLLLTGGVAHGHVFHDFAIGPDGGDVGFHPIMITVLTAIFYYAAPGLARLYRIPQVLKRGLGHVGVTDQVMGLADQLRFRIAADLDKVPVDIGDDAFGVGFGDDGLAWGQLDLFLGHRHVDAHDQSFSIRESGDT